MCCKGAIGAVFKSRGLFALRCTEAYGFLYADSVSEAHFGRSYGEAADIDGKIWFTVENEKLRIAEGEMLDVKITEALDYDLVGEALLNV